MAKSLFEKAKTALLCMQRYPWEQGVTMQAFWELGEEDIVIALAKEAAYRKIEDGRVAMIGTHEACTDPCSAGPALLWAASVTSDDELRSAADKLLQWVLNKAPRNKHGILYHMVEGEEFWVDSIYMLPPYLACVGLYDEALMQIEGYWNALFDSEKGLLSHRWSESLQQFVRKDFWGVGNGWAMAGLARVIDLLPADYKDAKDCLIQKNRALINAVGRYIRTDGLAHDVLDDTNSFIETNLPQMLAYSIFRGVRSGWLAQSEGEREQYLALAQRCRAAANAKVDAYGLVQGVCGAPNFISAGVAAEAQSFYLMMENEAQKMSLVSTEWKEN